jgi:tRNA-splicing ligase RtcB
MSELKKIAPSTYILEKEGDMRVDGLVIVNEKLLQDIEMEKPLLQVKNVATLPGIVGYSIALPDIHWGYGFPIGGVAAMDVEDGVISPGGVGYDINCGVRLAIVPIEFKSLDERAKNGLLRKIYNLVPSGVGSEQKKLKKLSDDDYSKIANLGARWSLEQGYGVESDLEHTESNGVIEGGDISDVSFYAMERGRKQIGSVGSGNHFIEIGEILEIEENEIAKDWGVEKGYTYILIHTGSRGFGHQICQDTLNDFVKKGFAENLPDKQLVCAKIKSSEGKKYLSAMSVAANFAFNNRHRILHLVREAFFDVCNVKKEEIKQLYDVCHNIAKIEEYEVDGKLKKLCVHRKGATRAFGKGEKELAPIFQKTGQPVLVPGDMERASYLLVGLGNKLTWCSSCHGAGRAQSRVQSFKTWKGVDLISHMKEKGVEVMAKSRGTIAEEMPGAYKDVEEVVKATCEAKLAKIVAKLKPHLVIKG